MPMLTLPAELGAPAGPDRVPENLGREPGGAVMTADPGLADSLRMPPGQALMVPATQGQLTAWACGLDEQDVASGRARCGDFLPELMIELI